MKIIQALDEDKVPVGVLPIAFGILADKERQYQGEATTIIEHRKVVTIDEVQKELESIKNEAIDVEPGE